MTSGKKTVVIGENRWTAEEMKRWLDEAGLRLVRTENRLLQGKKDVQNNLPGNLPEQLRARSRCIQASSYLHISEKDARDFAELFELAASEIESLQEALITAWEKHQDQLHGGKQP